MSKVLKTLCAAVAGVALMSGVAVAQDSATVEIGSGTTLSCDVDAVATGLNVTIGLDQTVADISIECNYFGDVNIDVSSADGQFTLQGQGPDLDYSIDFIPFDGGFLEFTAFDNVFAPFDFDVDNTGGIFLEPFQVEVRVNVDGPGEDVGLLFAGERTDDLTITLSTS